MDVSTRFEYVLPTKALDTESTMKGMSHARVPDTVSRVYSDGGSGLVAACEEMGINRDPSQPNIHEK